MAEWKLNDVSDEDDRMMREIIAARTLAGRSVRTGASKSEIIRDGVRAVYAREVSQDDFRECCNCGTMT